MLVIQRGVGMKSKLVLSKYIAVILVLHLLGGTLLFLNLKQYPQIIGFSILAYTLGLRHAFDADHIAAIDNVVRKFVQQKKDTSGVGFFFSLGHSSVVFIMAIISAFSMQWAENNIPQLKEYGGILGTVVSGCFLIIIGVINLFLMSEFFKLLKKTKNENYDDAQLEKLLQSRGLISRFLGFFYNRINKGWHMYPLGFMFGLGFDTASEIALLAISVNAVIQNLPVVVILALPLLFAAGMSLMDTADVILMSKAYSWAFATPLRKIYYNLFVTGLSVVAAILIGTIELIQLLVEKLGLNYGIWQSLDKINLGFMGYLLVIFFILFWSVSFSIFKFMKLEKVNA